MIEPKVLFLKVSRRNWNFMVIAIRVYETASLELRLRTLYASVDLPDIAINRFYYFVESNSFAIENNR
jgi:hypothetical protein